MSVLRWTRAARRGCAVAVILLTSGCSGILEPPRPDESPAFISLLVQYQNLPGLATGAAATGLLEVGAYAEPGFNDRGRPRRLGSDTLVVRGARLAPIGCDLVGACEYYLGQPLSRADYGSAAIDVVLPTIEGITEAVPPVRIPVVTIQSPDTIDVGADSLLRIAMSAEAPDASPAPVYRAWRVELPGTDAGVAVNGTGPVPAVIVLPVGYLTFTDGLAPVLVRLRRIIAPTAPALPGSVVVNVDVTEYYRVIARRAP